LRSELRPPDEGAAILLVCNGPGELTTWVRPLASRLHERLALRPRCPGAALALHLVLVPCPNANGSEARVAGAMGLFERVLPARRFWRLLLWPRRYGPWPKQGVVVFLGGDQFWTVLLSARLGYRHLTYAEWVARWPQWNDRIAAMGPAAAGQLARRWQERCTVVGDLMADVSASARAGASPLEGGPWVAVLPGSKRAKLLVGVPFLLRAADELRRLRPEVQFVLPVAPTTSAEELMAYAGPASPFSRLYGSQVPRRLEADGCEWLETASGTRLRLLLDHPAHAALGRCSLALTTVGANTAELGALGVPMLVIVPTQHLEVMQAWDGGLGVLARLPLVRRLLNAALTAWRLRHHGFLSWPNISAGRAVVPERVGRISPEAIAAEADDWLAHPERLADMRTELGQLRGAPGAVDRLADLVLDLLPTAGRP